MYFSADFKLINLVYMYNQVWKKYLPIINIQLKRASSEDRTTDLNRMDFERAGIGRKTGYKFTIQLTNGRVSNVISGSPIAMNLAAILLEDDNTKKILKDHIYEISMNTKFQLITRDLTEKKPAVKELEEVEVEA